MDICGRAGSRAGRIIRRERKIASTSYGRPYPFVFERGRDVWLWDVEGRRHLDFAAGIATMNAGHTNPAVVNAVRGQLRNGTHAAFPDFHAETPVKFMETLLKAMPSGFGRVFLTNSGTESVEAGLKLAKWRTRKRWLVAFDKCFHGRTMGSLSMTNSKPVQREGFGPFLPVKHVPFPNLYRSPFRDGESLTEHCTEKLVDALKDAKGGAAGVFVEPIQGEGGYVVPPEGFHGEVRKICTEEGVLLCADEVQTGCYRTGPFLAFEGFGVKADIVCMAKALGGGLPLGAMVARKGLMEWPDGAHSNTFGGNLLACAAGTAALEYMEKKRLGKNARFVGKHMLQRLEEMKPRLAPVGDVRGRGLMIGVEMVRDKGSKRPDPEGRDRAICSAYKNGLLLLPAGKSVIRICPPLTLTMEQADKGLDILEEAIGSI